MGDSRKLSICLISAHGLIRGTDPELGRDADTGGQVRYVLDLARALGRHPEVERVDLLTRQVLGLNVAPEYGDPLEQLSDTVRIVRLPFGPHRYLHKESLWPWLPQFVDQALVHFRSERCIPDVIHGHYADAGWTASRLSRLLDVPLVFTGHSMGRVKQARLRAKGTTDESMERRYRISRRIAAEEAVIEAADLIVTSTAQEASDQYGEYESAPRRPPVVIPPGIHLESFRPPRRGDREGPLVDEIERFLRDPRKPWILALQRPDERKNLGSLIRAYGEDEGLREAANLVLVVGTRNTIGEAPKSQRVVFDEMLRLIDDFDLYGHVAYPKRHDPAEVPDLYRAAARRHGVFVNPALTEPFGLTLIEAAASGLPMVAPEDGGPENIMANCRNGCLVDTADPSAIAGAIADILGDRAAWQRMSRSGFAGAKRHYTWDGHVRDYLREVKRVERARHRRREEHGPAWRLVMARHMLVSDIDNTLLGDDEALGRLSEELAARGDDLVFAVATGRTAESAVEVLAEHDVPPPDVVISAVGSELAYGFSNLIADSGWYRHIDHDWDAEAVRELLDGTPGLELQEETEQRNYKVSFYADETAPSPRRIRNLLRKEGLRAKVIASHGRFLDVLPERAGKGEAVRYLVGRWGMSLDAVITAGDSGNDLDMLRLSCPGIVVGNGARELRSLRGRSNIYFAEADHAAGIREGLRFFGVAGGENP
jgi:sucrose-phosphate synthase